MKKRMSLSFFLAIIMVLSTSPVRLQAETNPWDSFAKYLPVQTPVIKSQLRGAWICTVVNMDWPSKETRSLKDDTARIQKSKAEMTAILDKAVGMNLNAVFFQVSPEGDAFYKSSLVPWSRYLTGVYGKDPGFDPLAFVIEEAHKRNLELHAWFNPYRLSMDTKDETKASMNSDKSVYKDHPDWIKTASDRFVVDPGIPEARKWVINRVAEVLDSYDIDGVHLDDYFYYEDYEGQLKDDPTYVKYNNGKFSNKGNWRRNNTYLLVKELSSKIRSSKPWVKFGISPSGVWGNKKDGHSDGSNTDTSYTNYETCFADTKKWVQEELLDYIAPQIYFTFANTRASYGEVASWWVGICKGKKVQLYIGQALYKINDDPDPYFNGENAVPEFTRQLKFSATKPEITGSILFRINNLDDLNKQPVVTSIRNDLWFTKVLVPVMSWKGGKSPESPSWGKIDARTDGLSVTWIDNDPSTTYYAVYRFNIGEKADIQTNTSAAKLIGTVRSESSGNQKFEDLGITNPDDVFYVVTALDRLHHESTGLTISIRQSNYFSDVGMEYAWAVKAIDHSYESGIIVGDLGGRFNPSQNTKRGDFVLMMIKALGLNGAFMGNFLDVPEGSYYYDAIGAAKALEIVKGFQNCFNPGSSISREDMMVIVSKALAISGIEMENASDETLAGYYDAHLISAYARESIASLIKAGIIHGVGGSIKPKSMATRAEVVVVLNQVLTYIDAMNGV